MISNNFIITNPGIIGHQYTLSLLGMIYLKLFIFLHNYVEII